METKDQSMDTLKEKDGSGRETLRAEPAWGAKVARRSFMKNLALGGAALLPAGAFADQDRDHTNRDHKTRISKGDADILRFLAAAEILEADLWQQYNELGGIQDSEVPGGSGNPAYTAALSVLDGDVDQYVHDNTDDEFSHF